jgi:hypothetical protein
MNCTLGRLKLPELMLMVVLVARENWDLRRVLLLFSVAIAVELLSNREKFPPRPCSIIGLYS